MPSSATRRHVILILLGLVTVGRGGDPVLWYDRPASQWVEALPVGNGRLGAMVFGDPLHERIQLNEDSLWAGGPYDPARPEARAALGEVRRLVFAGRYDEASELADSQMISQPRGQMAYQTLGDLHLDFDHEAPVTGYRRSLDLSRALLTVSYVCDRVTYRREIFASHPDQLIVIRLSADRPGRIGVTAGLASPQTSTVHAAGTALSLAGRGQDAQGVPGQVRFLARVAVTTEGGTVRSDDGRLHVTGADTVVLRIAAATSYVNWHDVSGDPEARVTAALEAAATKPYDRLRNAHVADYRRLFDRVSLDLGADPRLEAFPTDQRLKAFGTTADNGLVSLFFQYGRYLLISSSRPGDQPATLQGIWNESLRPPWSSKYTLNINCEMNYWIAEPLNLAECHEPLFALIEDLSVSGRRIAQVNYGARGWVTHHNTDAWRAAGPIDGAHWGLWPTGGAWLCRHLWDHYDYGGDRDFLRRVWPVLRGCARFFLDTLVEHPGSGWLVTCPSLSPEMAHPNPGGRQARSICAGPTLDNQLLRDLFTAGIETTRILDTDRAFGERLVAARARLAPNRIGRGGQLQEWLEDWDLDTGRWQTHRHVSHLYGLFPSSQINAEDTPELYAAARRSLELRGDEGTGWSLAWKINLWARLHDAEHAYRMLERVFRFTEFTGHGGPGGSYANLFGACPPFQIDANFGAPSGICEMLLQSYAGRILLLPALPRAWPRGRVTGLRARGGFTVDIAWEAGRLTEARITSQLGRPVTLDYADRTQHLQAPAGTCWVLGPDLRPRSSLP